MNANSKARFQVGAIVVIGLLMLLFVVAAVGSNYDGNLAEQTSTAEITEEAKNVDVADTDISPTAPAKKKAPEATVSQKNALDAAENYIQVLNFSKAGLFQQLTSKAGDGYSKADATWALKRLKVDWKDEAVESAKIYIEMMPFSRSELIKQLTSKAGDQYTKAQATYAVDKVGL